MKSFLFLAMWTSFGIVGCKAQKDNQMVADKKVLVIGRHADMLTKVVTMLKANGYHAVGEQWNEQAMATFKKDTFHAVIVGGGVDEESRAYFHREFPQINPLVKVINSHPQTILLDLQNALSNQR